MTNQNAFSANMLQFRYKNYLFLDLIDSVVWPKRFELGYIVSLDKAHIAAQDMIEEIQKDLYYMQKIELAVRSAGDEEFANTVSETLQEYYNMYMSL